MDTQLQKLIKSKAFKSLQPEVALTYLILRADIREATSGDYIASVSVHTIAQYLKSPEATAIRCLETLQHHRWLYLHALGYCLGNEEYYLADYHAFERVIKVEETKKTSIEKLRAKVKELTTIPEPKSLTRVPGLHEDIKTKTKVSILEDIVVVSNEDKYEVLDFYFQLHSRHFGERPKEPKAKDKKSARAQCLVYIARGIKIFDCDVDKFKKYITFVVLNWKVIIKYGLVVGEDIEYRQLGNVKFWDKIKSGYEHGIKCVSTVGPLTIRAQFLRRHQDHWGYPPKDLTPGSIKEQVVQIKLIKKGLQYVDTSEDLLQIVDFIYDNWDELTKAMEWDYSSPGWKMLGSKGVIDLMKDCMQNGISAKKWKR